MAEERPGSGAEEGGEARAGRARLYGWLAAGLFVGVAVVSALRIPPPDVHAPWLAAAAALVLVSVGVLAAEYRTTAWLLGVPVGWSEAVRVTLVSSAANLLPVPGSLAVRTEALRRRGSGVAPALGANLLLGLGWLAVSLLLAGALLAATGAGIVSAGFLAAGAVAALATLWAMGRLPRARRRWEAGLRILAVETVYVAVSAVRLFAVLAGLGMEASLPQATALTVASALAAGVGFFPAGLGLRELFSGALAPLVGLAPAVGAFAGVVDRIVALLVRAVLAGVFLGLRWTNGGGSSAQDPSDAPAGQRDRTPSS